MTWVIMWAMGTMVATTPAMTPAKGMVGTLAGRQGGGLLVENAAVAAAAAAVAAGTAAAAAAYCWGCFLFIVKIFLCGILCVGGIGEVTPPLTLSSRLRYVGILLGRDGNCPKKLWYVNTKNCLAKKHGN
jgi:hypothetical protein